MNTLERLGVRAAVAVGAGIAATVATKSIYEQICRNRLRGHEEAAFAPSGMIEFYAEATEAFAEFGLEVQAVGGMVKRTLRDENTIIDPVNRTITISDREDTPTRVDATLYRKNNNTLRDMDGRVVRIRTGVAADGTEIWEVATHEHKQEIERRQEQIQMRLDELAGNVRGKGPQLSLFAYDDPFTPELDSADPRYNNDLRIALSNYASRTEPTEIVNGRVTREKIFDNNGNSAEVTAPEPWTCIVRQADGSELRIPTISPEDLVGRTLTRSIEIRKRDLADVVDIMRNLRELQYDGRPLLPQLFRNNWEQYVGFRLAMNESLSTSKALDRTRTEIGRAGVILAIRPLISLEYVVEKYFGTLIQDPEGPFAKQFAEAMGATGDPTDSQQAQAA